MARIRGLPSPPEENGMRPTSLAALLSCVTFNALAPANAVAEEDMPRSFVASPEIYKVIGENEQYRVIEATWKPGQRDKFHSHGATVASYALTNCHMRNHLPDGKTTDNERKPGAVGIRSSDLSHSQENIGKTVCKMIIFEPK
jgi:hypothetical protein